MKIIFNIKMQKKKKIKKLKNKKIKNKDKKVDS